jgi:cobalamin biosynthesis Mg chelatase CobN
MSDYNPISFSSVLRKTPEVTILNIESSGKSNVLNNYRSYTYNFTLAAVRTTQANNPENYRKSSQDFVILRSGGKGSKQISENVVGSPVYRTDTKTVEVARSDYEGFKSVQQKTQVLTGNDRESAKNLVQKFNKKSPGRFDMYIDNVEINTLMAPSKVGGLTLPTNITFDVFEPYSINGFIEALQVTAQAAGYDVYSNASFLLKIDFIGYKDDRL